MRFKLLLSILCLIYSRYVLSDRDNRYTPDWNSLDSRPLPKWYDDGKFGIFCHWGVYSVPALGEWFWINWQGKHKRQDLVDYMKSNFKPSFTYQDFGPMFTAEFFNADEFAQTVKMSGAKYFVFTSKHHEGYTMWQSNYSWGWNSMDVGPHRDIIGELRKAFDKIDDVHLGLYYSLFEWFNPIYLKDQANKLRTHEYIDTVMLPQMKEVVNAYRPDVIWSDGDWEAHDPYWKSKDFLAWLYNESPVKQTVVTNDRWGIGSYGKHGGYYSFADRYDPGYLIPHKWEQCLTLDSESWGYRRTLTIGNILPFHGIVSRLARTIRYTSKLHSAKNLKADRIFNPQVIENTVVFAFVLKWPKDGTLILSAPGYTTMTKASMLGVGQNLPVGRSRGSGLKIDLTSIPWYQLPSTDAWVLKLEYLASSERNPMEERYGVQRGQSELAAAML